MIYVLNDSNDPYYNSALEEFLFEDMKEYDKIFMLWINEPTVYVGKFQNTISEINLKYIEENNINVIRRNSGGGAVYHDLGNLNYTIISNEGTQNTFDFKKFAMPVIEMLKELDIAAESTGRNDISINGKKICGNAQYMRGGRVLHHGCILFDVNLENLQQALNVSSDKIESKGLKSVRSRVDNVYFNLKEKFDNKEFSKRLLDFMIKENADMKEYVLSESDKENILKRRNEKFKTWDWIYGKSPEFNITRKRRFTGGGIQANIDVKNGFIKGIKFYGDFFSNNDIEEFENLIKDTKYEKSHILNALNDAEYKKYFPSFEQNQILESIID